MRLQSFTRRVAAAMFALLGTLGVASAADYPVRPIKWAVPTCGHDRRIGAHRCTVAYRKYRATSHR